MPVTYNLDVTKFHAANGRSRRSKRSATPGTEPTSRVARPCGWGEDAGAQQAQGPQRVNRFTHMDVPTDGVRRRGAPGGLLAPGTTVPVGSRPVALAAERKYLGVAIGPVMAVTTYAVGVR